MQVTSPSRSAKKRPRHAVTPSFGPSMKIRLARWRVGYLCIVGVSLFVALQWQSGWQRELTLSQAEPQSAAAPVNRQSARSRSDQPAPQAARLMAPHYNPDAPTIIGGKEARPDAWPWMVALVHSKSSDATQGQFCGGTLIGEEWVLTAAHCTYDLSGRPRSAAEIDVVVGRHRLSQADGQRLQITQIIRHPGFIANRFNNDLALLQTSAPAAQPTVRLLPPEQSTHEQSGIVATVIGWGITEDGVESDVLRQVEVPLVDISTCRRSYGIFNEKVTENMLCAGLEDGGKDSCQGDSGGPLVIFNADGQQWQQAGIVSWGEGCAQPNYYGVYTRVSNYHSWVYEQISEFSTATPTSTPTSTPITATPTSTASATLSATLPTTHTATPSATPTIFAVTPTSTFVPTMQPSATATVTATPDQSSDGVRLYLPFITMNRFLPLRNGGFERADQRAWYEFSFQQRSLITTGSESEVTAHSGQQMVHLGNSKNEVAFVQQPVTVVESAPVLAFWMLIRSDDDCGYDFGGVVIDDEVVAQFDLCATTASEQWEQQHLDLRAYGGRTVSLELRAETDNFLGSTLFVDDVAFVAATDAPVVQSVTSSAAQGRVRTSSTAPIWAAPNSTRVPTGAGLE